MTAIMHDHAPRHEQQSSIERKRAIALRQLRESGRHVLQASFRYVGSAQYSPTLKPVKDVAK